MCILALDIATVTGFAVAPPPYRASPTPVERAAGATMPQRFSGSKSFRGLTGDTGRVYDAFETWLIEMIQVHKPDLIVFEAPFVGNRPNANTARMLFGLCALTEMVARRAGVRALECHNSTIKSHASKTVTGRGQKANKRNMIEFARQMGWEPKDDNEADALWLVEYAASLRGMKEKAA